MARHLAFSLRRLLRERQGIAAVEFGLIAPTLMLLIMGIGDLLYSTYTQSILLGAVQKAGRDATLEANNTYTLAAELDKKVIAAVKTVAPSATYSSTWESYSSFSNVDKPEPFSDKAGGTTGTYDVGIDCFTDLNGNRTWDADGGKNNSVGGAGDIVQYKITVQHTRFFPMAKFMGWPAKASISAQTLLKNQPYAGQKTTMETICP
jgi:Flp pilus assembly protein TadG